MEYRCTAQELEANGIPWVKESWKEATEKQGDNIKDYGRTEMAGYTRLAGAEIIPLPESMEKYFTGRFPVYSGHEIHKEMVDSEGNDVPIIHKDIPNMDDPIHVQLAVMRVLEALQTQLKTGELKRLHVCLCRMPDGKMKLMATLSAFPEENNP